VDGLVKHLLKDIEGRRRRERTRRRRRSSKEEDAARSGRGSAAKEA